MGDAGGGIRIYGSLREAVLKVLDDPQAHAIIGKVALAVMKRELGKKQGGGG